MPELTRMDIVVPEGLYDRLAAALFQLTPYGWEELEVNGRTVLRLHAEKPELAREIRTAVLADCPQCEISLELVDNKDWSVAWREFFTPVEAGGHFLVLAPWMDESAGARQVIFIEPRTAFGTGHHHSTRLCLEAISYMYESGQISLGQDFLDLGTGSGILGLACARLGLIGLGLDNDPVAVDNALENKILNHIGPEFEVRLGSLDSLAGRTFDLVLANILAGPLIDMAEDLASRLRPAGRLVLSGLLAEQAGRVLAAYQGQGLGLLKRFDSDEWAALVLARAGE